MSFSFVEIILFGLLLGPFIFVLSDKNTSGREKTGWAILTFFFGILALPFYLIKTKKS